MKPKKEKEMIEEVPTLVKWAGGKKQLLNQFNRFYPKKIERYFEPFVGGGAVAFNIIKYKQPKEATLSDVNPELINAYNVIKNNVNELIEALKEYKKKHSTEEYYKIRAENPEKLTEIQRAARFIYLNKTCFNGLYRVNSKGQFNVPIGSYTNPAICSEKDLIEISKLLKKVNVKLASFEEVTKQAKKGDFIYLDPPYYPLKKGKSFTKYASGDFLEKEQEKLAEVFKELNKKGCSIMLSNSDTEFIKNLYKDFNINLVQATRMINCDATKRGKINEVVITNYPTKETQKTIV